MRGGSISPAKWILGERRESVYPVDYHTHSCCSPDSSARLADMAAAALVDGCTATNPRTPSKEEIIEIYKKIW